MTEKSSETETFVHDVLAEMKHSAISTETIGHKLAHYINIESNKASTELWNAIGTMLAEAISDATQIDSYVHVFQYFFANLRNDIQDKALAKDDSWIKNNPDEDTSGRNQAIRLLGAELREGVDSFRLYLPREFVRVPGCDQVISTNDEIRRILAIDTARNKYININSLIGRLWALDVVDTSGLVKMLLNNFCDNEPEAEDNDPDDNKLDDSELNIESACALIRATSGKLELSVGKPKFTEHLKFLENILRQPNSSFFLKVKITETLRPYY